MVVVKRWWRTLLWETKQTCLAGRFELGVDGISMMSVGGKTASTRRMYITVACSMMIMLYMLILVTQFRMIDILHTSHVILDGSAILESEASRSATTATASSTSSRQERNYEKMAISIVQKWNLTALDAVKLLIQQFHRPLDTFNPQTDFVHFHHLYKSGGTSISNLMDKTLGINGGILPGSYESGNFDHDEALADIQQRLKSGTKREDLPYLASYAHTGLRPVYGPKRTKTGAFLLEQLPHRRLRAITMLRDIVDFRASNHAMIMCGLNYEVTRWNNEREARGLERVCSPKDGLNISALVDRKIHDLLDKCQTESDILARHEKPKKKLFDEQRRQCAKEKKGIDTLIHCRSANHLLASHEYDKHYRSMFTALMGRYHRKQEFTNSTAYGRMGYGFASVEKTNGYSSETVQEYTLQDLGGLTDTAMTMSGAGDGIGPSEPDFVWFGITERMKESVILFYYQFRARQSPSNKWTKRVQECRPNSWWTDADRAAVIQREPADYAVWRAANAIMDVRVEKMKLEIQELLRAGKTRDSLYYVDWGQLEEIGVNFNDKQ